MNLPYKILPVAGNPWLEIGRHSRVESKNGMVIAAPVLRTH